MSKYDDWTFIKPKTDAAQFDPLPIKPSSVPGYVCHVSSNGSRSHVLRYGAYTRCSVRNCIVNYRADQEKEEDRQRGDNFKKQPPMTYY